MTWKEDDICLLMTPVHLCLVEAFNWQDLGQNLRPRNQKSRKTLHFLRKAPKRITICQAIFWLPWWLGEVLLVLHRIVHTRITGQTK